MQLYHQGTNLVENNLRGKEKTEVAFWWIIPLNWHYLFVCFFYVPLAWLIFSSLVSATLVSLPWPVLVHPANNCSFCFQAGKEYQGREAEWYSRFPKDQSVFLSLELDMRAWLVLKGCTKTLQKWAVKSLPCPNGSVQCSICKRIKASWNLASHGLVTFSDVSVLILVC